jgi:hypothetical protein
MSVGVVLVGSGEYTMGYVETNEGAASDKPAGGLPLDFVVLAKKNQSANFLYYSSK